VALTSDVAAARNRASEGTAVSALAALGMRSGVPGFVRGALEVAKAEVHGILRHPGLYLFVPLILLQTLVNDYLTGAFDTPLLYTSGTYAVAMMNTLTLLVSMMILFYTTESLQRERSTGFGAIAYATPLRTAALLAGKAMANTVLGVAIVVACLLGSLGILAYQGHVPLDLAPFALVWGLLLVPTFLLFTAFVSAVQAVTSNRYVTYTVGLAAMIVSGWAQARGHMNWVWNWDLWSVLSWTDIAPCPLETPTRLVRISPHTEVLVEIPPGNKPGTYRLRLTWQFIGDNGQPTGNLMTTYSPQFTIISSH